MSYGYISEIKEIEITKEKASQKDEPLTIEEARQLRRVAGQLNWAPSQTHPDMAYDSYILSMSLKMARSPNCKQNIRKMKRERVTLQFSILGDI